MIWGHRPVLGLDLHWESGRLRFYDPAAEPRLRSATELEVERDAFLLRLRQLEKELERGAAE